MRNDSQRSGDGGALVPLSGRVNNGIIPNSFKALSSYLRIVSSGASTVASTVRSAASAASAAVERERDGDTNHYQCKNFVVSCRVSLFFDSAKILSSSVVSVSGMVFLLCALELGFAGRRLRLTFLVNLAVFAFVAIVAVGDFLSSSAVSWAGFDKLELERGITRQVLLLGFSYGFQIWDVEVADNVHNLVSRHDGPVSFMQMLPKPLASIQSGDKFADSRPLLIICADGSFSGDINAQEGSGIPCNGSIKQCNGSVNGSFVPTVVWFYSLKSQSYVHLLRFRSIVHLVRCSSRVVAVLQSAQIHCLNAATLEREYTILINPVTTGSYGFGNIGVGPLAVGPRWMAYSGSQVAISNSRCVSPQHLTPSPSFPGHASNGSLVAHYAKESSKQLAAGTRRVKGTQVIVRDIVTKTVIAQFRAHKSPILSLCFDPSGTLLVTASIQGHNINVFRIMPGSSEGSSGPSYAHLYRLQRGFTNAVIQDISFSSDSHWIMISSSRGTSHLFAISPSGGPVSFQSTDACFTAKKNVSSLRAKPTVHGSTSSGLQVLTQQDICASGPPVNLSAISRIRSGSNGWRNTVSGAAAAATGRLSSSLSGAIASAFREGEGSDMRGDFSYLKKNYYLLVFSPSGCVMKYALRFLPALDGMPAVPGVSSNHESNLDCDARLMVEAMQKWNICQKQNRKEQGDNVDSYGENVNIGTSKIYPEKLKSANNVSSDVFGTTGKERITTEEKHHMYISEAELQMHQNQNPLWARPEIYFQSMQTDDSNINEEGAYGGEIEIERVPTRMLEARSKDLVPVFDYLQYPKVQQGRVSIINSDNGQFRPQVFDASDGGSLDSLASGGILENELDNGLDEKGQNDWFSETSRGFVDTNDTPTVNTQPETVNTRDNFMRESQLRFEDILLFSGEGPLEVP
ncbi:hypothetical protein DH2020_008645 [Rehmannia glutinosa]|uniref:BCAS3 domain-containing protein n=1 Tax=Rehmannia glutinosa TaxID=99300 RepID=A0ABR0X3Z4_REHGL